MTIELENADSGEIITIETGDNVHISGEHWYDSIVREHEEREENNEVPCFYCKSYASPDYVTEIGIGKDGEMKYVCHKCFKQKEPMRLEQGVDGRAYIIPEGEYILGTSTPIPAEHFQGTWSDSDDTIDVYENTARYDGGATA